MACHKGNLESVKRIVEHWGVSVNSTAAFYYRYTKESSFASRKKEVTRVIHRASPLFVAAFSGHFFLVRYLIEKGANPSLKTSEEDPYNPLSGLTPLHGSLFSSEPEQKAIISYILSKLLATSLDGPPIWTMKGCGPEALSTLHRLGVLDLTQRCPSTGKTVLHQWASGSMTAFSSSEVDVVQLLLDWGTDLRAVDTSGFSVILSAAKGHRGKPNEAVLDVLLDREDIERMEKIKALEMTGAVILSHPDLHPEDVQIRRAFGHWRRALSLRTSHHLPNTDPLIFIDGRYTEWTTLAELKNIEKGTKDEYQTQSFLVLLRIFSEIRFNALDDYVSNHWIIDETKACLFEDNSKNYCCLELPAIHFFWIILTVLHRFCWHRSEEESVRKFAIEQNKEFVNSLTFYFAADDPLIHSSEAWKTSLELISIVDPKDYFDKEGTDQPYLLTLFDIFAILSKLPFENMDGLMPLLKKLVKQDYRNSKGENVLLYSVTHDEVKEAIIPLLIEAKVDLHSADRNGNRFLHLLALNHAKTNLNAKKKKIDSIARLLRCSGAHPDQVNAERKTAAQVWLNTKQAKEEGDRVWVKSDLPDWLKEEDVPKMICLAALIVRQYRIPYIGKIPSTLNSFVAIH